MFMSLVLCKKRLQRMKKKTGRRTVGVFMFRYGSHVDIPWLDLPVLLICHEILINGLCSVEVTCFL
jgi:hypothetical protein